MNDEYPVETAPVRTSHWRAAVVIASALGAVLYILGRLAGADDDGRFASLLVILIVSLGPLLCLALFTSWWVLLGDGRWYYRILWLVAFVPVIAATVMIADETIRGFTIMWGLPFSAAVTGLVLAVVPGRSARRVAGVIVWLLAIAPCWLLRLDGVDGTYTPEVSLRLKPTVQQVADANLGERATTVPTEPAKLTLDKPQPAEDVSIFRWLFSLSNTSSVTKPADSFTVEDWPGFRGAARTGEVSAAALHGWTGEKPHERWRHEVGKIGGAWSSFCIVGNALITQEQRGKSESVVCYNADTGEEIWARGEESKHYDAPSGTGPRATPSYSNGFIYAVSATGNVSCLRATTGEPVWKVSLEERVGFTKPMYGLATSPLVMGGLVIVNPGSPTSPRLAAFDAGTGQTRWTAEGTGTDGYSSPHPATISGVEQVLIFNGSGLYGHDPATGRELWHYDWTVSKMEPTTVQPLVLPDGRIVVGGGNIGLGCRCARVKKEGAGWTVAELWRTTRFTPKFNDVVCRGDYLYGLDSGMLSCIKLSNGERMWKDGRYDAGQILLAGDKLLVISEKGQLACVAAKPEEYEELWKFDAVKGKTWNHPAIAHGRLYIRNMGEMAAYDLK